MKFLKFSYVNMKCETFYLLFKSIFLCFDRLIVVVNINKNTILSPNVSITSLLKEISHEYSLEGLAEAEAPTFWPPDVKN